MIRRPEIRGVATEPVVGSETDRGLFITAPVAAGYQVIAVNPIATSRYRERLSTSGAKSDAGDARVLADIARLDGHNHRRIAGDTELAEAVKVLARAHQNLICTRMPRSSAPCQDCTALAHRNELAA